MQIITDKVHPDEGCYGYYTGPRMMPGWDEDFAERMVEFVFVVRGDAIAKYVRDFGPASEWPYTPPLMIPSVEGENRVGECMEAGERHRNDDRWARRMREYKESSTLWQDILRQHEQRSQVIANRTNIGPYVSVQRNGYSRETNQRNFKQLRQERSGRIQL